MYLISKEKIDLELANVLIGNLNAPLGVQMK